MHDATTLLFYQQIGDGTLIRIIDCYSNNNLGLDHYVKILQDKPYRYGKHFAPHDIRVREWGGGAVTRYEKARQLGITFTLVDEVGINEGIENVWTHFAKLWINSEKCRSFVDALENYRKEWDDTKSMYLNKPVKSWACFTGDTLVLTRNGMRPIIELKDNDYVLTNKGWQPCTKSFMTRKNASLVELTFNDGTKVKCTPDHMFLTEKGWISAEFLTPMHQIQSSSIYGFNIIEEVFIDYTKQNDISVQHTNDCIEKYGQQPLDQSQEVVISTIKMEIRPIMLYSTSFAFLKMNIEQFQSEITKALEKMQERLLLNGTDPLREGSGTSNKQSDVKYGKHGSESQEIANIVENHSIASLEAVVTLKNTAIKTVRQLHVVNVKQLESKENVYCITVPDAGHFSLANGAIVKNCHYADTLRYLCLSLHKTKVGMTPEDFERKKAMALYGGGHMLPPVFDDRYNNLR